MDPPMRRTPAATTISVWRRRGASTASVSDSSRAQGRPARDGGELSGRDSGRRPGAQRPAQGTVGDGVRVSRAPRRASVARRLSAAVSQPRADRGVRFRGIGPPVVGGSAAPAGQSSALSAGAAIGLGRDGIGLSGRAPRLGAAGRLEGHQPRTAVRSRRRWSASAARRGPPRA